MFHNVNKAYAMNELARGIVLLATLGLISYEFVRYGTINEVLLSVLSMLIGYYFGEISPLSSREANTPTPIINDSDNPYQ